MKNVKRIILILCAFALMFSLVGCNGRRNQEMDEGTLNTLWFYASILNFVRRIVVDGEEIIASSDFATVADGLVQGYLGWADSPVFAHITPEQFGQSTDIRFYSSEEEARSAGHPDNVILVWPHEGALQGLSNRLYLTSLRIGENGAAYLEERGVSLPLTIENIVEARDELGWATLWGDMPGNIALIASERGALAFTEEIEIFRFAGSSELDLKVREHLEQLEVDIIEEFPMIQALFNATGSPEAFIVIAERMEAEGLTMEQMLEELEN